MSEMVIFLVDLALVVVACVIDLIAASGAGRLAAGVDAVVTGAGLLVLPPLAWEAARTDNAFLGLYLIGLLAVLLGAALAVTALLRLRGGTDPGRVLAIGGGTGLGAALLALAWLLVRGPGAWATGSGQFGLDVVAVAVVLGAAAHLAASRLAPGPQTAA